MSLKEYHKKRDFTKTSEPVGEKRQLKEKFLRFFIQKHDASHLHYDFRLECDGVLKSWAIPKGPSLNPADKRLAMMVEDHPFEYGDFEGVIPEGNYGAGTVLLWDQGFVAIPGFENREESEKELKKMLYSGNVKLLLMGEKVKGEFALVKTNRKGGKGNEWLLIKKKDDHASNEDVLKNGASVLSGLNLRDVEKKSNEEAAYWHSPQKTEIDFKGAPKKEMPEKVKPMLASLAEKAFNSSDWIFEIKWDGYRAVAEVNYNTASLYSRNGLSFSKDYPAVIGELKKLGHQVIFDGEIVVLDEDSKSSFQLIQNYKRTGEGNLVYYIFDILFLDGHDLTNLPLVERKAILQELLPESPVLRYSDHVVEKGEPFFLKASEMGLEGIIAKKATSVYQYGKRVKDWLKVKILKQQETVIAGYTEPRGGRKKFGALVLGVFDNGELKYIGHSGTGFNSKILDEVYDALSSLERKDSPFNEVPKTNMPVKWVEPKLVCEVKFQEWTSDGIMRHPVFLGLREDKKAEEVSKEVVTGEPLSEGKSITSTKKGGRVKTKMRKPLSKPGTGRRKLSSAEDSFLKEEHFTNGGKDAVYPVNNINLKFTNLSKIYWPDEGFTKRDLIEYYFKISDYILPYLKNRPESLKRHPNGISSKGFFQKNMPDSIPDWVKTEDVFSESNNDHINYLICNDLATLLYMANLGCIEINPWSSRIGSLDNPDFTAIDLDPNGVSFDQVIEVAQAVKAVLDKAGISGYPKTSGSRGIHIYIPLGKKYTYNQAKDFTYILVSMVNSLVPKLTTLERTPSKRKSPIYLDYLQNRKGQTLAAPYCVRPKPGATVSTPLQWEELEPGKVRTSDFTINSVFDRLNDVGDLFEPVLKEGIDIEKALEKLS